MWKVYAPDFKRNAASSSDIKFIIKENSLFYLKSGAYGKHVIMQEDFNSQA